jgi:hypothetical protein
MPTKRKIFFRIVIVAAVLIGIALFLSFLYLWSAGAQLNRKLAALRAAGDPTCLADLVRKPVASEQNAWTYLLRAQSEMEAFEISIANLTPDEQGNYKSEDIPKIEDALKAHSSLFPLLEQAAACPDFDSQLDYTLPPYKVIVSAINNNTFSLFRSAARCVEAKVQVLLSKGDRDEAMRSGILMLQLSRQLEREPELSAYFTSIAIKGMGLQCADEILQSGLVSEGIKNALDKELSLEDTMNYVRAALKTDLAFSLDQFEEFRMPGILSYPSKLTTLKLFEKYLSISLQTFSDWNASERANLEFEFKIPMFPWSDPTPMLAPTLGNTLICAYRNQALVRSLRIINALQGKTSLADDTSPTMAELGLPDDVGIDPFNGKPMIIKKLPAGWLVYSVGKNLKYDGGDLNEYLDVGFGPKMNVDEKPDENTNP